MLTATPSYPLLEHLASLELVELRTFALEFHRRWEIHDVPVDARTRAIVVVNPNNPTGSFVTPRSRTRSQRSASRSSPTRCSSTTRSRPGTTFVRDDVLTFTLGGLSKSAGLPHFKLALDPRERSGQSGRRSKRSS